MGAAAYPFNNVLREHRACPLLIAARAGARTSSESARNGTAADCHARAVVLGFLLMRGVSPTAFIAPSASANALENVISPRLSC